MAPADLAGDPRFAGAESVRWLASVAVVAAPLRHEGTVYGVIYLEREGGPSGFPREVRALLAEAAELAGAFLHRALEREALETRARSLEHGLLAQHDFCGILTQDVRMLELLQVTAQVASSEATVLLLGETGTGKELLARALHVNSRRKAGPFVTVHCGALPTEILESELFGHTKGAFTGADRDRVGRFASARGGTLFLDEIAEVPLAVQSKLLRAVQFGEIQRLGSDRAETVDVRIVAATHQDLPALIQAGRFRQDLYYRLKVLELRLPPLRERRGDIPLLAALFLDRHGRREGETPRFTREALQALQSHGWPGNVRELEHAVQRACLLAAGPELGPRLLPEELQAGAQQAPARFRAYTNDELKSAREAAVASVEREFLAGLLERHGGKAGRAAHEAGFHRTYLYELLARHRDHLP